MFYMAEPEEIGAYLSELIASKFKNQRQFCESWIKFEHMDVTDEEINKKANKFSQIKKGKKEIQTYDLPVFCSLLDTSCEKILSAGKRLYQNCYGLLTNYKVAACYDEKIWEEYINHNDNPVLNSDEYGKTLIDYAVCFKNTDLINYLINKKYIMFDCKDENVLGSFFYYKVDVGIEKNRSNRNIDYDLYGKANLYNVTLRGRLIELALEKNNVELLKKMKVSQIPDYAEEHFGLSQFNLKSHLFSETWDNNGEYKEDIYTYYNNHVLNNVKNMSEDVVDYFTDPIKVEISNNKSENSETYTNEFMYFYISELLDSLIREKHSFAEMALKKAVKYNKETYSILKKYIEDIRKEASFKINTMSSVFNSMFKINQDLMVLLIGRDKRNIIEVREKSSDGKIEHLIKQLNDYVGKILNIRKELLLQ